jgi:REP element-mobilizing transposase RayT
LTDRIKQRQVTLHDALIERDRHRWGGHREGAGRRPARNAPVHHLRRAKIPSGTPAHVVLKLRAGTPSLRTGRFLEAWRRSLRELRRREGFRVVHYSVQRNHAHFIVEASHGKYGMECGMKAVAQRFARCVQRVFGREGPVLYGRYQLTLLTTPRQVRHALAYVLLNARWHWSQTRRGTPPARIDPCSSGRWFDGWTRASPVAAARDGPPEVSPARFWLLTTGWRRYPRISPAEVPGESA